MRSRLLFFLSFLILSQLHLALGQEPKSNTLQFEKWSKGINVPDPVAISFDSLGRAYVTQTTRRKANDLDIRNNRDWTVNDVSFESVNDKREFYRARLATELSDKNRRRVKDLNGDGKHDFHDLMHLSERIHLVQDTNGDGFADSISVYADNFQTEVTGIAAGVLHFRNADNEKAVYATIAPDVWKLVDNDGDGKADQRQKVATGFGLHIAYAGHDMHGLTVGPDGKIYWSIGDKGISVTSKEGHLFHYPNQGGVLRCNPDGSEFEVFAHGLRNVQELAFDQYGNLFGVDNDADQPGERERFVYIVKGMDAGWRCHYQYRGGKYNPWTAEKLWQTHHTGQPAYIIPPIQYSINGPCGFAFNPGTALNERYKDYFFLTGAPHGEQIAFKVVSDGASFKMEDVHQIGKGVALIGINFGPDGALYGVDWANGYPLNKKGAIWRIDSENGQSNSLRRSTQKLLRAGLMGETTQNLVNQLDHPDQRVRMQAQFELVRREGVKTLSRVALNKELKQLARIHAIWGIGQLNGANDAFWKQLLGDDDPEILAQSLRVISDFPEFNSQLFRGLLESDSPRVKYFVLQALAKHGDVSWLPELKTFAEKLRPEQTYLRHAMAIALAGCGIEERALEFFGSSNDLVDLTAVVALRHAQSSSLALFLVHPSKRVREETARAIHDDFSIKPGLSALAACIDVFKEADDSEAFMRRALNANLRLGKTENLKRLLKFVADDGPEKLQVEVLDWIANWENPYPLDAVTGRFRDLPARKLSATIKQQIEHKLTGLLSRRYGKVQTAIVKTLGKLKIELDEAGLRDIVLNPDSNESLAIEALGRLAIQNSDLLKKTVDAALRSKRNSLRLAGIEQLIKIDAEAGLREVLARFDLELDATTQQKLIQLTSRIKSSASIDFLNERFRLYLKGQTGSEYALELLEAVIRQTDDKSEQLMDAYREAAKTTGGNFSLGEFQVSLNGGHVARGKKLFETHIDAQCTRCHRVGKNGSTVGPPLDGIGTKRKPAHLLTSIIQPSAEIAKEYQTVLIALYSGKALTGVKIGDGPKSITIADAMGKRIKIERDDIEQMKVQKKSLMPDMTKTLTKREIRDLVAYLKSLK